MARRSLTAAVLAALSLAGCADGPSPVTAQKVLDVPDLRAVVNAVALSPDGTLVVVGDLDGVLTARDVAGGGERWRVAMHTPGAARRIDAVVFSPDGALLVSTGHDARTVEVWEAATGRQVAVLKIGASRGAAFHPTERALVIVAGTTVYVVDIERATVVRMLPNAHRGERMDAVAFAGDGRWLATASELGSLKLWSWRWRPCRSR
jgi:WD40 repeat protein